jgi:hypothetical protein
MFVPLVAIFRAIWSAAAHSPFPHLGQPPPVKTWTTPGHTCTTDRLSGDWNWSTVLLIHVTADAASTTPLTGRNVARVNGDPTGGDDPGYPG